MPFRFLQQALTGFRVAFLFVAALVAINASAADNGKGWTDFSSVGPVQGQLVVGPDGNLYGATAGVQAGDHGTIFRITPPYAVATVAAFNGTNGSKPNGLTLGIDGNFYGTTSGGGPNGLGTVFRMTPGGVITTLHSFAGGLAGRNPGGVLARAADGTFYGFSVGTVFAVSPSGQFTTIQNGVGTAFVPGRELILGSDGNFYGTAERYGAQGKGVVFRMDRQGFVTLIATFGADTTGAFPVGGVIEGAGYLYGCLRGESAATFGIYRLKLDGTQYEIVSSTSCLGPLVRTPDGSLYGEFGPTDTHLQQGGAVWRLKPGESADDVIAYDWLGMWPTGGLTLAPDKTFYGYTGGYSQNRLFRLNRVSSLEAKASYNIAPVARRITFNPQATLTDAMNGTPIVGRKVTFVSGAGYTELCSAYTGGDGLAKCQARLLEKVGADIVDGGIDAVFEIDQYYTRSSDHAPLICVGTVCTP